jgi:putative hydrolase of the HAD superfamily
VPEVSLLLWDVGGVLLSNGWDHEARRAAASRFGLDGAELERRHESVADAFETGQLDLEAYLEAVVFHAPRAFSPAEFRSFMFDRSTPRPETLELARALHRRGGPLMGALNNESRELNEHRIAAFHLRDVLDVFLTSCYTGLRKPDPAAYRYALALTQREPGQALFLDDRPENVAAASGVGMHAILVREPERLAEELTFYGISSN